MASNLRQTFSVSGTRWAAKSLETNNFKGDVMHGPTFLRGGRCGKLDCRPIFVQHFLRPSRALPVLS